MEKLRKMILETNKNILQWKVVLLVELEYEVLEIVIIY